MRPPTPCALLVLLMGSARRWSAGIRQDPQGRSAVEAGYGCASARAASFSFWRSEKINYTTQPRRFASGWPATVVLVRQDIEMRI